jgi:hypothetical protein
MKTTIAWASLLVWSGAAMAQEQDDMYFNKKDRAKLQKATATEEVLVRADKPVRFDYAINKNTPAVTSGAAYETNPEFIARSQSEMVSIEQDEAHFIENYQYNQQNELTQFSNNLNQWNNNPLYSNAYFAPSINNWNSPFYSPFNDPFLTGFNNNPWCNPMFRSGWSVSFNFAWGNGWNYWGPSAFWGWGDPFWNNGWNSYAWGNNWGWNNWNNTVIIIDNDARGPVYGKRGSRSQGVARAINSSTSRTRSSAVRSSSATPSGSRSVASRGNTSQEYYTPQWRRSEAAPNVGRGSSNRTYTPANRTSESFSRPSSGSSQRSSSFSSPSRSSGSFSSPSRSGGSSGGGSRSSSSRGRGN